MPDRAAVAQRRERFERLLERHRAAPVQQVQIEIVGPQALQAVLARRDRAAARRVLGQHLADEIDLLAPPRDDLRDELFGAAVAVHLGRVDKVQTKVEADVAARVSSSARLRRSSPICHAP